MGFLLLVKVFDKSILRLFEKLLLNDKKFQVYRF